MLKVPYLCQHSMRSQNGRGYGSMLNRLRTQAATHYMTPCGQHGFPAKVDHCHGCIVKRFDNQTLSENS